uniref:Mitochondrial amidoxime reducing component 2-like n=1 Tax=Tanacetum cinerariifolium TaxID=118510 RepID=A0A699HIB8_TANCI|nr:mitochondrial amidoxime reducing component 2-like [Tanacetum cinerariifolium]
MIWRPLTAKTHIIDLEAGTKSPASRLMIYETKQLKEFGRTRTQETSHNDIGVLKNSTTVNLAKVSSDYKWEERRRLA